MLTVCCAGCPVRLQQQARHQPATPSASKRSEMASEHSEAPGAVGCCHAYLCSYPRTYAASVLVFTAHADQLLCVEHGCSSRPDSYQLRSGT